MQSNEKENQRETNRNYLLYRIRHLTLLELLAVLAILGIGLTWVLGKLF